MRANTRPIDPGATSAQIFKSACDSSGQRNMTEIEDLDFQSQGVSLAGTLVSSTQNKTPITILMLHGSGPMDRDENMKGMKLDVFRTFADDFGRAGIGSFRYDKRGCGKSGGIYKTIAFRDLIDDACAAVDMLVRRRATGKILLFGHSEGTILAPLVAHRRPEVCGLILLCPTVQPMENTLMAQAVHLDEMVRQMPGFSGFAARLFTRFRGNMIDSQRKLIARIKTTSRKTISSMGMKIPVNWLRELLAHDLEGWMRKVDVPVLAISGAKDIQCLPGDSHRIAELAHGPVEAHCLDDLTHILRTDTGPASFLRYGKLMENDMDPRIMSLCLDWLSRQDFASTAAPGPG